MMISPDLSQDPTLGRIPDWRCPACGNIGAVFFQLPERIAEDAMTLVYVCIKNGCGHSVKQEATQDIDADADDSGEGVSRVKTSSVLPEVKKPLVEGNERQKSNEGGVGAEVKEEEVDVDAEVEGDVDLFGDDQGFNYQNVLEEEIAQNDEFDEEIAGNELEQEIALEGEDVDENFGFGRV
ncbi:hypothetical protein Emed_006171 [Eimeria media]